MEQLSENDIGTAAEEPPVSVVAICIIPMDAIKIAEVVVDALEQNPRVDHTAITVASISGGGVAAALMILGAGTGVGIVVGAVAFAVGGLLMSEREKAKKARIGQRILDHAQLKGYGIKTMSEQELRTFAKNAHKPVVDHLLGCIPDPPTRRW